jgi:26S proteasome non-ATPase regulatory subunit 9
MNTSLLTPDGFPRADIDVVTIRTTRSRIIHLRNDWKELMNVIEKRLHEHFATVESDESDNEEETKKETTASAEAARVEVDLTSLPRDPVPEALDQPFAKVNTVADNSPAAAAGLKPGDLIRNFGYVNFQNHDNLRKVGECVQGNEGVSGRLSPWRSHGQDG